MTEKVLNEKQLRRKEEFRLKNEKRREQTLEWRKQFGGTKHAIEKRAGARTMGQMQAKRLYQKGKKKENVDES